MLMFHSRKEKVFMIVSLILYRMQKIRNNNIGITSRRQIHSFKISRDL